MIQQFDIEIMFAHCTSKSTPKPSILKIKKAIETRYKLLENWHTLADLKYASVMKSTHGCFLRNFTFCFERLIVPPL